MTRLRAGGATDVGRVRTNNEDQLHVGDILFVVADGMGGHAAGEVASLTAVEALKAAFERDQTADGLSEALRAANRAVWQRASEQPDLRGMGTTATATALVQDDGEELLAIANVGDSRAYLFRDGELDQISEDHSLPEEMVRRGELAPEDAALHPQRHILTRVLGMDSEIAVDCFRVVPYRGDRILLASDGLTNEVSDDQIASILRRLADPEEAARELVRTAKENGGSDNITVVVVDVLDDDDRAEAASAALASSPAPPQRDRVVRTSGDGDDGGRGGRGDDAPSSPRPSRITGRVVAFFVVLALLIAATVGAVVWYARSSYYVGIVGDRVGIFKGRPGGVLGFDPTLEERTDVLVADVPAARQDDIRAGKEESSLAEARRYVANLEKEAERLKPPPTTTTVTTPPAVPPAPPPP